MAFYYCGCQTLKLGTCTPEYLDKYYKPTEIAELKAFSPELSKA
jgi:hypothetical protein